MDERARHYVRSFSSPDDMIEIDTVRSEMISMGGMTVSHDVQQRGSSAGSCS